MGPKLKRVTAAFEIFRAGTAPSAQSRGAARALRLASFATSALTLLLAGCPQHPGAPAGPRGQAIPGAHLGRPYDVVAGESLLTILVYRAGPLAKAGHNHVIASHELSGTIYVPTDLMRTTFEVRVPVGGMTVDEAALRAQEGADFSADVPDSARDGTRRNMLGQALLDAERFPQIVLQSERLEPHAGGQLEAHVQVQVKESPHSIVAPVRYEMKSDELVISGEMPLRQTDLGLTPFSALLGALQVQDEMRVKFHIVARAAH